YDRSMKVLRFLRDKAPQEHGHFYHFLNMRSGQRVWNCEVSNIDTALLMGGVLTVRQHFKGTDLAELANELYERVEWTWLLRADDADYFRNGQLATIAQRQWCMDELSKRFKTYGPNMWGLTASDSRHGYEAWGGPPAQGPIDGSVVPAAPAGSLAFEPRLCVD